MKETKCKHGVPGNCLACYNENISHSDKTWEERYWGIVLDTVHPYFRELGECTPNELTKKIIKLIQSELTSATIKARETGWKEGYDFAREEIKLAFEVLDIPSIPTKAKDVLKAVGINLEEQKS